MAVQQFLLTPDVFRQPSPQLLVVSSHENEIATVLDCFLGSVTDASVGIAGAYDKCALTCLALASSSRVLLVRFVKPGKKKSKLCKGKEKPCVTAFSPGRALLARQILCAAGTRKFGLHLDRLVTSLFLDLDLRMADGVDIIALTPPKKALQSTLDGIVGALGGWGALGERQRVVKVTTDERFDAGDLSSLAVRAWACLQRGTMAATAKLLATSLRHNTVTFLRQELAVLSNLRRHQDKLDALKPTRVRNDIKTQNFSQKTGNLMLNQTRFKTRMRVSASQHIVIKSAAHGKDGAGKSTEGRAIKVRGKEATVQLRGVLPPGRIKVFTIGKEEPTAAESVRAHAVHEALQRTGSLLQQEFFRAIWLPLAPAAMLGAPPTTPITKIKWDKKRPLNASQTKAVESILDTRRITVIHGGPGTGKTTVIAAAVMSLMASSDKSKTIWLVAQSNVAVKNIAEKLASCKFWEFRLLVSFDFHFDWHEHLYERLQEKVIRSDELPTEGDITRVQRLLGESRVILCTLSTLANSKVSTCGLTQLVPVRTVVVDEASQIEVGDYVPLLHLFSRTLEKMVCIGDDKQLPPYGQDDVPDLQSIFELDHLRHDEVFLDTQYRMPVPLGQFISKHVYDGRLKTQHPVETRDAVQFIDVPGTEEQPGQSWVNMKEVQAVVHLARALQKRKKSFRIITPYDAQRGRIEEALKQAGLKWEDKVFNVDSFQGNEDDVIVVSVVRTAKLGFLANLRRTNVMLSRCRERMYVVSNRTFLEGNESARASLIGKLAADYQDRWVGWSDLVNKKLAV